MPAAPAPIIATSTSPDAGTAPSAGLAAAAAVTARNDRRLMLIEFVRALFRGNLPEADSSRKSRDCKTTLPRPSGQSHDRRRHQGAGANAFPAVSHGAAQIGGTRGAVPGGARDRAPLAVGMAVWGRRPMAREHARTADPLARDDRRLGDCDRARPWPHCGRHLPDARRHLAGGRLLFRRNRRVGGAQLLSGRSARASRSRSFAPPSRRSRPHCSPF